MLHSRSLRLMSRTLALTALTAVTAVAFMALPSCGKLNTPRRSDAPQAPTLLTDTAEFDLVFGDDVALLANFHDSYEVGVKYSDGVDVVAARKHDALLTSGAPVRTGQIRRDTDVRFVITLFKNQQKTYVCESRGTDLTQTSAQTTGQASSTRLTLPMGCSVQGHADLTLAPNLTLREAADVENLQKAPADALLQTATESFLYMAGEASFNGKPAILELSFNRNLAATSGASNQGTDRSVDRFVGDLGELRLAVIDPTSKASLLTLTQSDVTLETLKALFAGKDTSTTLAMTGRVSANIKKGEALDTAFVDATYTLTSKQGAKLFESFTERSVRVDLVLQKGTFTAPDAGALLSAQSEIKGSVSFKGLPSRHAARISVASYNVENMWDDSVENTVSNYDDYSADKSNWYADKMYQKKVVHVAWALALAGSPDVVALEEIESAQNASRSLELLKPELAKLGYRYFALGQQGDTNPVAVTTAVISKYPIVSNQRLAFDTLPQGISAENEREQASLIGSARDPQVVVIDINGTKVRLYASHWKSRPGNITAGDKMREAAAALIRTDMALARSADPSIDILVLGDFNADYRDHVVVNALKSSGDQRGFLKSSATDALYNLWFELSEAKRCSYSFDGARTCIDNFLVSDTLFDNKGLQLVDKSFRVIGHQGGLPAQKLLNADGTPFRWQTVLEKNDAGKDVTRHQGEGFSDHLPLVADFNVIHTNNGKAGKVTIAEPSTTDLGPTTQNPDDVPVCAEGEPLLDLRNVDFTLPQYRGMCFKIDGVSIPLTKMGRNPVGVQINGKKLVLTTTRAYAENKDWLRGTLQKSAGYFLVAVKGRLGYSDGQAAVFINTPAIDLTLKEPLKCLTAGDATADLSAATAASLESLKFKCVSFKNAQVTIGDLPDLTNGKPINLAQVKVNEAITLVMRLPALEAQKLRAKSNCRLDGVAALDFFASRNEWQLNANLYNQLTGALLKVDCPHTETPAVVPEVPVVPVPPPGQ